MKVTLSKPLRRWNPYALVCVAVVLFVVLWVGYLASRYDKYDVVDKGKEFFGHYCDMTKPVQDTTNLPWAQHFRQNAHNIHNEFLTFELTHTIPRISDVSSTEKKLDPKNATNAWRSLFLRVYGQDTIHLEKFPLVKKLVAEVPHDVSMIMFSIFEGHYKGRNHEGIHRGVLRYLLGVEIPTPELCPIYVQGKPYVYGEGEDIYFDDTVDHRVDNLGDKRRVTLFLDVRRHFGHFLPDLVNSVIMTAAKHLPEVSEAVANANSLSGPVKA